jgi:hypothetical protein
MDRQLRAACFVIAAAGGALAVASLAFPALHPALFPATLVVGGTAALLFLRMLLSRAFGRSIDAINAAMERDYTAQGRAMRFLDPEWGLFGWRTGSPALLALRAVLFVGMLPIAMLMEVIAIEVVHLWAACLFVAMELSIMHAVAAAPRTPA